MKRVRRNSDGEAIGTALRLIPPRILERIGPVDFLTRTNPVFAGLHRYIECGPFTYDQVAHFVWPLHQSHRPRSDRTPTVVLPVDYAFEPNVIVHELGHALDLRLGRAHIANPVTAYAQTNRDEAFAEAFSAWVVPAADDKAWAKKYLDAGTVHLFEELAA